MTEAHDSAETALREIEALRRRLSRGTGAQVRSIEEKSHARATALAWFRNHRTPLADQLGEDAVSGLDDAYRRLLNASERAASRSTYESLVGEIRQLLIEARSDSLMPRSPPAVATSDEAPSFSSLVPDPAMQGVLERRWGECVGCLSAEAPLAATVMMGGLLEGLLLAKVNSFGDKKPVFAAKSAPQDRSGKTLPLSMWTLKNYIDVAHELGWISRTARDVGQVLRDYRNYVHPQKELSHGIALSMQDARLWWEVSKTIARELL
jgi:hypothetical protein